MEKKILSILLLLFMFSGGYVVAESVNGSFEGNPIVKLISGSKELVVSDVPAIIYKNRTMVPISLLNQLGVETKWDAANYSVTVKLPETIKIVHPALTQEKLNELAKSVYELFGSTDDPTKAHQGSGFIINGYMITNAHVSGDSAFTQVQIGGQWQKASNYAFVNKTTDVMGFKVSGGSSLPYSTVLPQKNDIVYAIGYLAGNLTTTDGTVTSIDEINGVTKINNTAHTAGGESGGILLNDKGEIIGITSSGVVGTNTNHAITISYAIDELNKLQK